MQQIRWTASVQREGEEDALPFATFTRPIDGATALIRQSERDRRLPGTPVPIVAYATADNIPDLAERERVGLSGVLVKPCGQSSLQSCLEEWCPDWKSR